MVNMICLMMITVAMHLRVCTALENINFQDDTRISLNMESKSGLCSSTMGGVDALGMESGAIPDAAITASSSYNEQSVGPQNARLNREISGGAWCPSPQLSEVNSGKEWLQVNLTALSQALYVVTAVATQGRFGNALGVEFTEEYRLEYSRDDGETWHKWRSRDGSHILSGNDDTYTVIENQLYLPLVGVNLIRVIPISQHLRTVCLRVELYGCLYKDGPISYSMPDGVYGGRFGDLLDKTYDGERSDKNYLSGGIGQLVDGIKGDDNYKVNKGFEWIGWKSTDHNDVVSMTFEFADIRNFTLASFHCNNIFGKEMEVFASAKIWFSFDSRKWSQIPEDFEYMPDHVMERARDVVIHLHHRIGRFIKFDLTMASKWMLISEVRIDSRPVHRNFREDLSLLDPIRTTHKPISPAAINNNRSMIRESFLLIVFSVLGLIITASMVFYIVHVRRRKGKMTGVDYVTMSMKDVATTPLYCEPRDVNRSLSPFSGAANATDPEYAVPDVIGGSPPSTSTFVPPNNVNNNSQRYYASADLLNRNCNTFSEFGNYHYASTAANCAAYHDDDENDENTYETESRVAISPAPQDPQLIPQSVPNLNETDVTLLKPQIGYSRFGDVSIGEFNDNHTLVILKALQNDDCRQEFLAELAEKWRIASSCDHFAKLYGFINSPDYVAMVIEHGDCDLRQFLKNANQQKVGYSTLIYIASEIASAMHQLQSMGFVHRDLAARNCLIYTGKLMVKITDSGAFITDYKEDYYKEVLPIRWMAPESLLKGRFTSKSDVYSFGVTLWEILTYCKVKPHSHLSDETLLKTVLHQNNGKLKNGTYYRHPFESSNDQRQQLILPKPDACSKEIYDLLVECWEKNEKARPEFREICVFLQRKNLGFQKPTQ